MPEGIYASNNNYSSYELDVITTYYPIFTKAELMPLLPGRIYSNIRVKAHRLGIRKVDECIFNIRSNNSKKRIIKQRERNKHSKIMNKKWKDITYRNSMSETHRSPYTNVREALRSHYKYREWRDRVYARDNYTCQCCLIHNNDLVAHHIRSFSSIIRRYNITNISDGIHCKELWGIENGVTLYRNCHKITRNYGSCKLETDDPRQHKEGA